MKKLKILVPVVATVLALVVLSVGVVLAEENDGDKDKTGPNLFTTKLAIILGLDTAKVDSAVKQARKEVRDETTKKRLDAMVEKGSLTQEQASEKLKAIQASPNTGRAGVFGRKMHGRGGWKGHHHGLKHFRGKFDPEKMKSSISEKLEAAVKNGELTEEQAKEKLELLEKKGIKSTGWWFKKQSPSKTADPSEGN